MIISGAMHYFRTHPEQWATRLHWLRLMGMDTVETYVPWNLHETLEGRTVFNGFADLPRFLDLAADEGLSVILRPGPYICAEWDNGGLPSWLTGRADIRIRTSDPAFLGPVAGWFERLLPRVVPYLATNGGPITLVQVENEYGSYGSDRAYLDAIVELLVNGGVDVPLCTSDGAADWMLSGGTLPGLQATVNFGARPDEAFAALARRRPDAPPFCMEWWNGWFDHWGEQHHVREAGEAAAVLKDILARGASVNVYMAHGGTNFGVTAGANIDPPASASGTYQPTVTSYDYDAPLDERGAPTAKFHAFRAAISEHRAVPPLEEFDAPLLPETASMPAGGVALDAVFDRARTVTSPHPLTFEDLGLAHGLVRYRTHVDGPRASLPLTIDGLADRGHLLVDGTSVHVFDRNEPAGYPLAVPASGSTLELVVESMGRVNYGRAIGERKGITGGVLHGSQELHGWEMAVLELPALPDLDGLSTSDFDGAGFHRFSFEATESGDAFVDVSGWGKGYVWVNGFNLGRYWSVGPQASLFLPAPVVVAGSNEVVVLELDGCVGPAPVLRPHSVSG